MGPARVDTTDVWLRLKPVATGVWTLPILYGFSNCPLRADR